jgi:hypothetical protein
LEPERHHGNHLRGSLLSGELLLLRDRRLRGGGELLSRQSRIARLELFADLGRPPEADVRLIGGLRRRKILLLLGRQTEIQRRRAVARIHLHGFREMRACLGEFSGLVVGDAQRPGDRRIVGSRRAGFLEAGDTTATRLTCRCAPDGERRHTGNNH